MQATIGFSRADDASTSVFEISNQIKTAAAGSGQNDILLAFCNSGINNKDFFSQLRYTFGETPVIGGGVIGVITNNEYEYSNPVSGAMLIQGDNYKFRYDSVDNIYQNEIESGSKLIHRLSVDQSDKALITFFESVAVEASGGKPPLFNESTWLCDGIYKKMSETIPLVGAGLITDYDFKKSFQFCGDIIRSDSAVGLIFGGTITPYCQIFHGCSPLDGIYHKITKMTGGVIEKLDGKPIVGMIDELHQEKSWRTEHPLKFLTLGTNKGDKFYEFVEANYVNRLIAGISPDEKGIMLMETHFKEGDEIQFMLRDNNRMVETAKHGTQELINKIISENKKPCFAFYIDCAGRAADFCNSLDEEAVEVQHLMNKHDIPLLGIYSGVEIAPFKNRSLGLDWTGVLFMLAEE